MYIFYLSDHGLVSVLIVAKVGEGFSDTFLRTILAFLYEDRTVERDCHTMCPNYAILRLLNKNPFSFSMSLLHLA